MTILVLFSSSFVLIDEHYCQGKLKSFSLFGEAGECDMDMPICKLENHSTSISKSSCCTNVSDIKLSSIFEKNLDTKFNFQTSKFISNNYFNKLNVFIDFTRKSSYYQNYSPPLIFKDILIFIQCFQI